jgi:FSR family fosmidomycin resistance protein-like MFS transporter
MPLLLDSLFSSIALGHLMVDLLNGSRPVLLAYLSEPLGLTNANIALISTLYLTAASITQPVFGWLSDRFGPRWLAAGGLLWMMSFFMLAMVLPGAEALLFLVIASLGSAALHPAGAMQATVRGRTHYAGRETTAASYFFLFGQLGLFLGPIIAGPLLDRFGLSGLLIPAGLCLPVALNANWQLRHTRPIHASHAARAHSTIKISHSLGFIVTLTTIAVLQAWSQQNMITFIPKYLKDLGQTPAIYGLVAGLFMGGWRGDVLANGGIAGNTAGMMLALASRCFSSRWMGWSPWLVLLVPLSGMLSGSVHSIIVVIAQGVIRGGMALASGLTLGIMFTAGAFGTLLSGSLADVWGFPLVFQVTAGLVVIAALATLQLRETAPRQSLAES